MERAHSTLFKSVPDKDYFHFYDDGELNYKKVVDTLEFRKEDVSIATNIPLTSVRYDEKMLSDLKERLIEWATAINLVAGHFKEVNKALLWFQIPNPLLGSMKPRDMIRIGRFKKLLRFIQTALDENKR